MLETDKLGKLSLSRAGCKRRDEYVISTAKKEGIPLVISLGGGYCTKYLNKLCLPYL
ncbi:MAG: hypothetical protein AAF135_26370 [Bacteroidota bacterium]